MSFGTSDSMKHSHLGYVVKIHDLQVYAFHGVNDYERQMGQIFQLDIEMKTRESLMDNEAEADSIDCTVNYSYVCRHVKKWMKENTCQLIETVADKLCREILENFRAVEEVTVTVKKPNAPIREMYFNYVSVTRMRTWHDSYLSLGSNSDDSSEKMHQAIERIGGIKGVRVIKCSQIKPYKAVGNGYYGTFLNNVMYIRTYLTPVKLRAFLREIESELGRRREEESGTRPIDIDILFYDDLAASSDTFKLPYPDMENRSYVLEPMCEIAPHFRHPLLGLTMSELNEKMKARS